ncbi:MAG: hypothetical protein LBV43_12960 [Prevotella sp.]|jgi:hypothetical protein|nr:hypothetical protein [Prevotella sp.]
MKKAPFIVVIGISLILCFSLNAQVKKLISEINSLDTKEVISFKYNEKNQLIFFDEKGSVTYREFSFKYNKKGKLEECSVNEDKGQFIQNSRFTYKEDDIIEEELKSSGKRMSGKITEYNKYTIDERGRLTKTLFDDGTLWEEFQYDDNNNLTSYINYTAKGDKDNVIIYKRGSESSDMLSTNTFPVWFWALQLHTMQWCINMLGKNNIVEYTKDSSRYGTDVIEVTYEFDSDGYPIKQYYDGELVREFKYKIIQ